MQEKAPPDKPKISTEEHPSILSDAKLRRLVSWFAVDGVIVLSVCCFGFMGYQAIWGKPSPENWLLALVKEHYAAVYGTPCAASCAFSIVIPPICNRYVQYLGAGAALRFSRSIR
jgi:hypothetical protein